MDKIKLVMTCAGEISKKILNKINLEKYEFSQITDNKSDKELIDSIKDADVVYLGGDNYFSNAVLENAPKLKLLAFGGIGYESFIDVSAANKLGIAITNTPEANSDSVAEFGIGLLLSLQRNIIKTNNLMKKGINDRLVSRELKSQEIGIIGMGAIGSRIAKILKKGFEANVSYYNRTRKRELENQLNIIYEPLEMLLKKSDIVFTVIPENKSTWNFIGKKELDLMKNTAILINPARPKLINPNALYDALKSKKIKACAMDGYYTNPEKDPYGLLGLDDSTFICSSDIACRTTDAWDKTDEIALKNISDFFELGTSKNIVNPEYTQNIKKRIKK